MLLELTDRVRRHLLPRLKVGHLWARTRSLLSRDPSVIIVSMLALNLMRVMSSLILSRLLAPADFGIAGIVTVINYTLIMLFDIGTDAFVIRHHDIGNRKLLDAVWTIRLVQAVLLAAVLTTSASAFARVFDNNSLTIILVIAALGFLVSAPQSLSISIAIRNKQLILVSLLDVCLAFLGLVATISLAILFRNYWALVVSSIIVAATRSLLSYCLFPSPFYRFSVDRRSVVEMWKFSQFVVGSSLITLFISQIDKFILGRFLTIAEFGTYMIAAGLAFVPQMFCDTYGARFFSQLILKRTAMNRIRLGACSTRN